MNRYKELGIVVFITLTFALLFWIASRVHAVGVSFSDPAFAGSLQRAAASTPPSSLTTGLLAYWRLDEASGTRNDLIGTNHLTDNNTVLGTNGYITNGALFVSANSEHLSAPYSSQLSRSNAFTLSIYVKIIGATNAVKTFIARGTNSATSGNKTDYRFDHNGNGAVRFISGDGSANTVRTLWSGVVTGAWFHLCAVFDPSQATKWYFYTNGALAVSDSNRTNFFDGGGEIRLGKSDGTSVNYADAITDDAAFWNRALSSAEVLQLSTNTVGYPWTGQQ